MEKSNLKVMVYSALWCQPCRMLKPIIEKVKASFPSVELVSVDIDESPEKAVEMNVRSVPTLVFIKDGNVVDTVIGLVSETSLKETINSHLVSE